jgi:hypothetical protein
MENNGEGIMGRPERHYVDYFPFFAKRGKTLNILQSKFGCEGIGVFTNILRFLSFTPDHHYCIKDETDRMNFFAEIGIQEDRGIEIIELMVKTEKLDRELWENHRVIVSEAFLLSLEEAYKQRKNKIITMNEIREKFISIHGNPEKEPNSGVSIHGNPAVCEFPCQISSHNTQSKVKKSKVKKSKEDAEASPPVVSETSSKPEKAKKAPLREREPANDMERVEKAYLLNWNSLYAQGKVKAINPVVNWNQTRKLLKTHFESFSAELIIQAINNGLKDDWILNAGYSLGTMLSASVLNKLMNGNVSGPQRHRIAADNVSQEKASSYFKEAK